MQHCNQALPLIDPKVDTYGEDVVGRRLCQITSAQRRRFCSLPFVSKYNDQAHQCVSRPDTSTPSGVTRRTVP